MKNKDYTKIQVPLKSTLRDRAEKVAYKQGYSSLQELIRVFLANYAEGNIDTQFIQGEKMSKEYEDYLLELTKKSLEDIAKGDYYVAHSAEDIIKHARELKNGK